MFRKTTVVLTWLSLVIVGALFAAETGVILPGPRPYRGLETTVIYVGGPALLFWTVLFLLWTAGTLRESKSRIRRLERNGAITGEE